jgi:hypothetical protein
MIAPYDTERSLERMQLTGGGPVRLGELLPELLARLKNLEDERPEASDPFASGRVSGDRSPSMRPAFESSLH